MSGTMVRKKHHKSRNYRLFILPALIFYTVFIAFPIVYGLFLGFTDWSGVGSFNIVGLKNFITIFTDERFTPTFFNALINNFKYLICVWIIITPLQYLLAYLLYLKIPGRKYIQFMLFLPQVISSAIVGFFATLVFDPNIGFANSLLSTLGLEESAWFGDPNMAFKLLIIVIIWQSTGTGIMIFYANFMDISSDVMEASKVDGCTEVQRFFHIMLPMSLPAASSNITMSTIWALAIFDLPYMLGGSEGGVSGSLDFDNIVFYRYTFGTGLNGKSDMGFGAAICVVMFVIMLIVTVIQNRVLARFDYNS
ncbi:MAG: sugar ABC transporter permease [Clostridiales bacterium]|nr:sugar ABC transporter permease [Clostridiales bacterium]